MTQPSKIQKVAAFMRHPLRNVLLWASRKAGIPSPFYDGVPASVELDDVVGYLSEVAPRTVGDGWPLAPRQQARWVRDNLIPRAVFVVVAASRDGKIQEVEVWGDHHQAHASYRRFSAMYGAGQCSLASRIVGTPPEAVLPPASVATAASPRSPLQ